MNYVVYLMFTLPLILCSIFKSVRIIKTHTMTHENSSRCLEFYYTDYI